MRVVNGFDELESLVGTELGASDWLTVSQEMIDRFADATRDHQWIHVNGDRAARESPYGTTIAHGFLTLSLVPHFTGQIAELTGVSRRINYGVNKVRFPNAVRTGARVRGTQTLLTVTRVGSDAARFTSQVVIEIDGETKPACVAETVTMAFA